MKLRLAFAFVAVAIGLHFYLTNHYYELSMGLSSADSICNVSSSFNCDTTSASKFATLLGIPIAAWGAATNGVLLLLILGWMLRWTDDLPQLSRYAYYLAGFSAVVSIVMGTISSFVLGAFCLFCMGTYLISWVVFGLLHLCLDKDDDRKITDHLMALTGPAKTYVGFLIAIPVGAFLLNAGISQKYGASELERYIRASLADWRSSPSVNFDVAPSMVKGASDEDAKFVISEFADFRCGHCKNASPTLNAFVSARKDVQLRFYNFPLDRSCNEVIGGGDGVSCLLAKAVTCSEKIGQKGWAMHDAIFADQATFQGLGLSNASDKVAEIAKTLAMDAVNLKTCIESDETHELVKKQAKVGETAGVKGTPAIYVNDRKLPRGQAIPVLQRAYNLVTK